MVDHDEENKLHVAEWANFPLAPCRLIKLHQYYYAIGNSPARNIFYRNNSSAFEHVEPMRIESWHSHSFDPSFEHALEKLSAKQQSEDDNLNVLCLACGDLRNVLFSLGGTTSGRGKIELVINDYDIHVLARNILLLDMIFDSSNQDVDANDETVFAIWFSTGLHDHHHSSLHDRLRKLINQVDLLEVAPSSAKTCWTWRCHELGLIYELKSVWQKWLGFFTPKNGTGTSIAATWEDTQRLRHATFLAQNLRLLTRDSTQKCGTATSRLRELIQSHRFSRVYDHCTSSLDERSLSLELKSKWKEDVETHLLTGVFLVGPSASTSPIHYRVNPTLFYNEDSYDLHYGTDSFSAFPFVLPSKEFTATEACFGVFKTWLDNARQSRERLSWTFSCLDCQTFCLNFDPKATGLIERPTRESSNAEDMTSLFEGALVVSHGLQKIPFLNGHLGVVIRKAPEESRWGVKLLKKVPSIVGEDAGCHISILIPNKPVSLKRSNLWLLTPKGGLLRPSTAYFDVISTSNVADHIGLSTLLIISRPLLVSGGTLLTTSFLHKRNFGSTKKYLKESLLETGPEWWSTLFGFGAMGYESDGLTSHACGICHSDYNETLTGILRPDSTIVWLANEATSNVSLAVEGRIVSHLMALKQNTRESNKSFYLDGKAAALLSRLAARELLLSNVQSRLERSCLGEVLRRRHLQHTGAARSDTSYRQATLCSFEVEDATLRRVFCSSASPTPTLSVKVNGIEFHGVWLQNPCRATSKLTRFFFWCAKGIMEVADWVIDLCSSDTILKSISVERWGVPREKLHRLTTYLTGSCQSTSSSERSIGLSQDMSVPWFDLSDLVRFELFDESSTHFHIRVQPDPGIFGECTLTADSFTCNKGGGRFTLDTTVRIPCNPLESGSSCTVNVSKRLILPTPVSYTGWKFQAGTDILKIPKTKYGFFSTVRQSFIPGCEYPSHPGQLQLNWSDNSLRFFSGAQFTAIESNFKRQKRDSSLDYQMPMLTEVKDTISSLMQLKDRLIYIHIKEPGIGIVAIVIRHGILMSTQNGVPILDLSVCFLFWEAVPEIAAAVHHMNGPSEKMRHVLMWKEEYRLFQDFCNYTRATMAPKLREEHPSLHHLIKKKSSRSHFRRVLLKPLFPSAADAEDVFEAALGSSLRRMLNIFG